MMGKSTKAYRRPIVCLNYGSKKDCVRFIAFTDAKEWVNLNPNLWIKTKFTANLLKKYKLCNNCLGNYLKEEVASKSFFSKLVSLVKI